MSCSKPLPPFTYDLLCYLNRDQLEHFSIVCRPLKKLIERYFNSKPYRVFNRLFIRGGLYALSYNNVLWHPNRDDYTAQQFLDGQICSIDELKDYYSFVEMRPYLGPTVRIQLIFLHIAGNYIYSPTHIEEMESIACIWRDGNIYIRNDRNDASQIISEDFQPILNSPTILQCQELFMYNAHFAFKDYKVLYTVKIIEISYEPESFDPTYWPEFFEQPGIKPIVVLADFGRENIDKTLDRLKEAFCSAILPNAFKIFFLLGNYDESLIEFRETNITLGEKLELKEGLPKDYEYHFMGVHNYTLERSRI